MKLMFRKIIRSPGSGFARVVLAVLLGAASVGTAQEAQNVIVAGGEEYFHGWPANHGVWSWGDEILVGFLRGTYLYQENAHSVDTSKPQPILQARSLDGGETWIVENPPTLAGVHGSAPFQFDDPDFAMRFTTNRRFQVSYDRGHTWGALVTFPNFGLSGICNRTNYWIDDDLNAWVFKTANKFDGENGRDFFFKTGNGGATWEFGSWLGEEPATGGYSIMPTPLRLSPTEWIVAVRMRGDREGRRRHWIELRESLDNGATWGLRSFVGYTGESGGNPPSLVRLPDGRLVIHYCARVMPFGLRARISSDNGQTWSPEIFLRQDGLNWDIGYPRTVVRPDGKLVTMYYYATPEHPQQHIAATIWDPDDFDVSATWPRIIEPGWELRQAIDIGSQEAAGLVAGFDIDGDGSREVAIWGRNTRNPSAFVYEVGTDGLLQQRWTHGFGGDPSTPHAVPLIAVGDVNGNGRKNIAVGRTGSGGSNDRIYVYEFNPSVSVGQLSATNPPKTNPIVLQLGSIIVDADPQGIAIGDLDGDGRGEILVATNSPTRSLAVFESDGSDTLGFNAPIFFDLGNPSVEAAAISPVGDFDGDGRNEVALLVSGGSRLVIVEWDGADFRVEWETGQLGGSRHRSRIIWDDLDGDGTHELIWTDYGYGLIRIVEALGPDQYGEDEPGGIKVVPGGLTPLAVVATGGDRPRSLWFGVQVSDFVYQDLYAMDHLGAHGDFRASAFSLPRLTVQVPGEMMSLAAVGDPLKGPASLDGNAHLDLLVGFRENTNAPHEIYWIEYTAGELDVPSDPNIRASLSIY